MIVVADVLVAQREAEDALADQRRNRVLDLTAGRGRPESSEAKRSMRRIALSVAPSSSAPASDVIKPPSNAPTTRRPLTVPKSNESWLHSVGIGELLCFERSLSRRRTLTNSEPRCSYLA